MMAWGCSVRWRCVAAFRWGWGWVVLGFFFYKYGTDNGTRVWHGHVHECAVALLHDLIFVCITAV